LAYYLTYTRVDDTKDSKTIKTTKTEVILTELKFGKTYSFVVRGQFVYLHIKGTHMLHFETSSDGLLVTLIIARYFFLFTFLISCKEK